MTRVGSYGRWHQDIYYLSNFNKVYTTQYEIENVKLNHICSISNYLTERTVSFKTASNIQK
jgi:hypothetical protein